MAQHRQSMGLGDGSASGGEAAQSSTAAPQWKVQAKLALVVLLGCVLVYVLRTSPEASKSCGTSFRETPGTSVAHVAPASNAAANPTAGHATLSVANVVSSPGVVAKPALPGTAAGEATKRPPSLPPVDIARLVLQNPFGSRPKRNGAEHVSETGRPTPDSTPRGTPHASVTPDEARANATDTGREAPVAQSVTTPKYAVAAIVTGSGPPAALIGDRLVRENDILDEEWRIVAINPTGIVIEHRKSE